MGDDISDIKKAIKEKKAVIGAEKTMKSLKAGKLDAVYLASNCKDETKDEIKNYSAINNTRVVQLNIPNTEFGAVCKKPFSISVLGVAKA